MDRRKNKRSSKLPLGLPCSFHGELVFEFKMDYN